MFKISDKTELLNYSNLFWGWFLLGHGACIPYSF